LTLGDKPLRVLGGRKGSWIPAFAGMTKKFWKSATPPFVIPAKAGIQSA
jgi:hypothetical protein